MRGSINILFLCAKRLTVLLHDITWIPVSIYLAYWFRFNLSEIPLTSERGLLELVLVGTVVHTATFWSFGCYRGIWRFASLPDLVRILKAVALGALVSIGVVLLYSRFVGVPRSVVILYPIFLFLGVSASRMFYRVIKTQRVTIDLSDREQALIVGAGRAGDIIIRDLLEHGTCTPIAIVDDDNAKQGTDMHGIPVVGKVSEIREVIETLNIETVIVAMPSAPRAIMKAVVNTCAELQVTCRTLPSLLELADGRVEVSRLRPVTVGDLLGRDPVRLDNSSIKDCLKGNVVAITGGGGSIGSELCRQVLSYEPSCLLILDSSEYNLYSVDKELRSKFSNIQIVSLFADVRISQVINRIFEEYQPKVVFHAAAYKHVPLVESNIVEAVRNNVLGTKTVADAAVKTKVKTFVLVSTDKTVNPTNVMGATKRIAEIYCQTSNAQVETHFVTTRFGNVLGSAGSVVPLFERQIKAGGPITITHEDITRYFMTIPEAASLILQAGSMGKGGEIFVLDMGKPVKIKDLAVNMIRMSGLKPYEDVQIEYIGLRPGEKMHEELFYSKEKLVGTEHKKLLLANCCSVEFSWLQNELKALIEAVDKNDETSVLNGIKSIVPEFNRSPAIMPESKKLQKKSELRVVK